MLEYLSVITSDLPTTPDFSEEIPASPFVLESSDFKVVQLMSQADAIKHGKHTGWCTGEVGNEHYLSYQAGDLFVFYRMVNGKKKRRPSYQLYVDAAINRVEFKKKGNESLDVFTFAKSLDSESPVRKWLFGVLPDEQSVRDRLVSRDRCNSIRFNSQGGRLEDNPIYRHWMGYDAGSDQAYEMVLLRARRMGTSWMSHTFELVANRIESIEETIITEDEQNRIQRKSYQSRNKFDQLTQSRLAKFGR